VRPSDEPWRAKPEGVVVACRLTPKSGRDTIDGFTRLADGTSVLLARVGSAPKGGHANDALRALPAEALEVQATRVRLTAGVKGRLKQATISGDSARLIARLRTL
jgi:hypothetical protein